MHLVAFKEWIYLYADNLLIVAEGNPETTQTNIRNAYQSASRWASSVGALFSTDKNEILHTYIQKEKLLTW